MDYADILYQKSLENKFKNLSNTIQKEIEEAVERGEFECFIYNSKLMKNNRTKLIELGFSVIHLINEKTNVGEAFGHYYKISWEKSNET